MGIMLAQLDIHDTGPNFVDILIKDMSFEAEVRVGIEELVDRLYIVRFQPLYSLHRTPYAKIGWLAPPTVANGDHQRSLNVFVATSQLQ
jgi:hypothetical protein